MPTIITRGAGSAQGLGYASSSAAVTYIEDVFSTYLYTGNGFYPSGGGQTITNNIDLSGKGGMLWIKSRSSGSRHALFDTNRGVGEMLTPNETGASVAVTTQLTAFNNNGFSLGSNGDGYGRTNDNGNTYASWTFREQPKFFDVVTYTGTGSNTTIAHNLGSVPGAIWVKRTDTTGDWQCYHRSLANTQYMVLNTTAAVATGATRWNSTTPTSSVFSLGTDATVNASAGTYVAYLFAHNAGGFGLTGTDNVISCGSFTTSGAGTATVNLGYEPQWLMLKNSTSADNWYVLDNMRGFSMTQGNNLNPNESAAEGTYWSGGTLIPTSTGFSAPVNIGASQTWIYVAIRRGPMKVPTSGTSVFNPAFRNATLPGYTSNFPVDWATRMYRPGGANQKVGTRLLGGTSLQTNTTSAAASDSEMTWDYMSGWGNDAGATSDLVSHMFRRAPGFFDVVCYTGTGVTRTVTHNLTVAPELMIVKSRSGTGDWKVWNKSSLFTNLILNSDVATQSDSINSPTTTTFSAFADSNTSSVTYVAYLFATVAGVSKVGSYTGTGTTQTINCGFTAGARFVLIKRTDSTGDWYVWDSARGIVAGNDPYLLLNSTAAEVTGTDYVDTAASGFEISSTAPAAINANGGSFIFLAIA